jgi:cytochrome c-type biogenesis protein CcmH
MPALRCWARLRKNMKLFLKVSLAAALLLPLLGQTVTTGDPEHLRLRAIGEKLKCQCSCPYTVGSCNMLNCHSREEINAMILPDMRAGVGEAAILAKVAQKFGTVVLAAPPAEGFNLVGWIMPFIALVVGLIAIRYILARWRRPRPAAALPAGPLEKFQEQIDKELADLE